MEGQTLALETLEAVLLEEKNRLITYLQHLQIKRHSVCLWCLKALHLAEYFCLLNKNAIDVWTLSILSFYRFLLMALLCCCCLLEYVFLSSTWTLSSSDQSRGCRCVTGAISRLSPSQGHLAWAVSTAPSQAEQMVPSAHILSDWYRSEGEILAVKHTNCQLQSNGWTDTPSLALFRLICVTKSIFPTYIFGSVVFCCVVGFFSLIVYFIDTKMYKYTWQSRKQLFCCDSNLN